MNLQRLIGATLIALVLGVTTPVRATAFSTDQSDIWSAAGEPGWAIQFVHRGSTIFATMYVYGPSGQPTFYTATLENTQSLTWSGDLIATTGPWFGTTPYNPAVVTTRKVGTMTWNAPLVNGGTLTYSVDGVPVSKALTRFLVRYDDYSGTYLANLHTDTTGCTNAGGNGSDEGSVTFTITQNALSVSLGMAGPGGTCTFTGTLSQAGQFGAVTGTFACTTGDFGTFQFFEMYVGFNSLTGRLNVNATNNGCKDTGYFAAIRHR